ncbi:NAD-dependent protein deacetylase sirtuin-6 [Podochytrium sp. JEL0797]|nr:NAD-dependent protein deacetylase sirtuin-6 [Podochytrium sp. JEL0797]
MPKRRRQVAKDDEEFVPKGAKGRSKQNRQSEVGEESSDDEKAFPAHSASGEYQTYAARLIQITDKGLCGDEEIEESDAVVREKVIQLAQLIRDAQGQALIHTGAGISTSAGVPDFRGPNGVWTREGLGLPSPVGKSFHEAIPTFTHHAITSLVCDGRVAHVVSQNVDGLHVRAGLARDRLSEVHGTAFAEWCVACGKEFRTVKEVVTIGLRKTGNACVECGGALRDLLCDWDSELPKAEVDRAIGEHKKAGLVVCVGSSLRIRPAGNWPLATVRRKAPLVPGKLVVINLQKTHVDKHCASCK